MMIMMALLPPPPSRSRSSNGSDDEGEAGSGSPGNKQDPDVSRKDEENGQPVMMKPMMVIQSGQAVTVEASKPEQHIRTVFSDYDE
jgi:hypothetical protein